MFISNEWSGRETTTPRIVLGERKLPFEDFVNIYVGVKNDKDMGVYEDFIECLKLYDKAENGYMQLTELTHMLTALGMLK